MWLRIVLREGRKRQIRETGSILGLPVVKIIRVRIGTLYLGNLQPRQWRHLTQQEVDALKAPPAPGKKPARRMQPKVEPGALVPQSRLRQSASATGWSKAKPAGARPARPSAVQLVAAPPAEMAQPVAGAAMAEAAHLVQARRPVADAHQVVVLQLSHSSQLPVGHRQGAAERRPAQKPKK